MRRITIVLACAMIAPLAFGQATISKQMEGTGIRERVPTQITTRAVKIGTVTAFDAGLGPLVDPSLLVVQSSPNVHPVSPCSLRGSLSPKTAEQSTRTWSGRHSRGAGTTGEAGSVALLWLRDNATPEAQGLRPRPAGCAHQSVTQSFSAVHHAVIRA
jgi:hypothetical protein